MESGNVSWSVKELFRMLEKYEDELRAADLRENTVRTYVDRSRMFVRWLDGDFHPHGPIR